MMLPGLQDEFGLLARARRLEPDALGAIHDHYYAQILRYISFRIGDEGSAEDLTSEVFMRLLSALRGPQAPQRNLGGWLFGVAANLVSDYHRRAYRAPQVALDIELASAVGDPVALAEATLEHERLRAALEHLTDEQQHVLALRFGRDLPIQQVARTLGKSEGAVKQLQARAISALARLLQPRTTE